jgi:hypothetical protein
MKFADSTGEAQKNRADGYEFKMGENRLRMVGDLLARYVYWIKGENNKNIPFECLAFDRVEEKFTNIETDHVKTFYPDQKCSWAYAVQAIDLDSGKLVIFNLKKKLMGQILDNIKELGDPTDPDTGWDIVFEKKKTGPLPINVEYKLKERALKNRPLTDEERQLIAELKSMDEVLPRPTPEQQKKLLEKINSGSSENVDESVGDEFNVEG